MARATTTYTQAYGSATAYKNCYQTLSTTINSVLTRTADTGQVNWAAVATEPSTFRDYEIFSFTGSLQATSPIYLRVDYIGGSGSTAGLTWTIGTATDGAGNLSGLNLTGQYMQSHTIPASSPVHTVWASSDGTSYFTLLYALEPGTSGTDGVGMIVMERSRDLAGAATGAGYHFTRWYATTATVTQYVGSTCRAFNTTAGQPSVTDYTIGVTVPDLFNNTTAITGTTAYAFPAYTYVWPQTPGGASKALMLAFPGDFPRGQPATLNHYGESMTFISLADALTQAVGAVDNSATPAATYKSLSPLIRWD